MYEYEKSEIFTHFILLIDRKMMHEITMNALTRQD